MWLLWQLINFATKRAAAVTAAPVNIQVTLISYIHLQGYHLPGCSVVSMENGITVLAYRLIPQPKGG